jgi:hypothetical protein
MNKVNNMNRLATKVAGMTTALMMSATVMADGDKIIEADQVTINKNPVTVPVTVKQTGGSPVSTSGVEFENAVNNTLVGGDNRDTFNGQTTSGASAHNGGNTLGNIEGSRADAGVEMGDVGSNSAANVSGVEGGRSDASIEQEVTANGGAGGVGHGGQGGQGGVGQGGTGEAEANSDQEQGQGQDQGQEQGQDQGQEQGQDQGQDQGQEQGQQLNDSSRTQTGNQNTTINDNNKTNIIDSANIPNAASHFALKECVASFSGSFGGNLFRDTTKTIASSLGFAFNYTGSGAIAIKRQYEVPKLDDTGNPVLNKRGKQVMKDVTEVVTIPEFADELTRQERGEFFKGMSSSQENLTGCLTSSYHTESRRLNKAYANAAKVTTINAKGNVAIAKINAGRDVLVEQTRQDGQNTSIALRHICNLEVQTVQTGEYKTKVVSATLALRAADRVTGNETKHELCEEQLKAMEERADKRQTTVEGLLDFDMKF